METSPPSPLLLIPLAIVYLTQTVMLGNLSLATKQLVGKGALNIWTYVFFTPIILASLDTKAVPVLEAPILWTRAHFVAIITCMLVLGEAFLRAAVTRGTVRLAHLAENSGNAKELVEAVDALAVLGLDDMAIVGLRRLAEMDPRSSRIYSHLASLYGIQRRFIRAEKAAQRAIELDPNNPYGYYYLGMAAFELEQFDLANQSFKSAKQLGLNLPDSFFPKQSEHSNDTL